jgi:anthranilate phosphoribosyltransferase
MTFEQPLPAAEITRVMTAIMTGQSPPDEIRTFLTALARRGETAEEIATAVGVLRAHAVQVPLSTSYELCDTCGTGGDGQGTINVSTLAALVAAAAGVRVVKHGNRAASSRCGSADLFEALGVNLEASPAQVARCIEEIGFGFCFAPRFHPAMKAVAPIRRELGIRTIFNLIGPLANPAPLTFQLVGVSEARWMRPMADALARLGVRHGMVVHGRDGLDEVTTTGETAFLEVQAGAITEGQLDPETLGLPPAALRDLQGGDTQQNAQVARELLAGTPSARRDIVVINAGCAIYVADQARTVSEGIAKASEALASGRARKLLEQVKELSTDAR